MPDLQHLARTHPTRDLWSVIDRDGGVIVDDFLSTSVLERLRAQLLPHVAKHEPGSDSPIEFWTDFHGTVTKRITGLCTKSAAWAELLCDPIYSELGDHYLGENAYSLNTAQLICIGPDETPQLLHRDEQNWPGACGRPEELTITAIFALTDFSEENGATVVVPGSHLWTDPGREIQPDEFGRATMKAGAALLYSGKIIHGGGPNSTPDEWRVGLHAGFVSGWLRAEENHQLTTPIETARALPKRVQHLLGFRSFEQPLGGRLGLVDYEDAAKLL